MVIYILSLIGVAVFSVSGALAAGRKQYDWVGVAVIATVTALGGGTLRDILLNRPSIFWIDDPAYLWITIASCILTLVFASSRKVPYKALLIADALGLALFSITGAQVAEAMGTAHIVTILMGVITGSAGGIFRDVLTNETPVLFSPKEPLYSLTSVFGIGLYLLVKNLGFDQGAAALIGVGGVTALRFAAIFWSIRLPVFKIPD